MEEQTDKRRLSLSEAFLIESPVQQGPSNGEVRNKVFLKEMKPKVNKNI
jgi:hypothetical protein